MGYATSYHHTTPIELKIGHKGHHAADSNTTSSDGF